MHVLVCLELVLILFNPFLISLIHFRCTGRNGNFAVLVKVVLLMIIIISVHVFLVSLVGILT